MPTIKTTIINQHTIHNKEDKINVHTMSYAYYTKIADYENPWLYLFTSYNTCDSI